MSVMFIVIPEARMRGKVGQMHGSGDLILFGYHSFKFFYELLSISKQTIKDILEEGAD